MKNSIISKTKLWVIITVAVLVVGIVLFAIFGLNKSVDYKDSYEVVISVDDYNVANADGAKDVAEKFFKDNGYKFVGGAEQVVESSLGYKLIYKFAKGIDVNTDELQQAVAGIYDSSYNMVVSVEYNQIVASKSSNFGWVLLALGIAVVACFVYVLIFEKFAGALSMILSALLAGFMYFALASITRVPVNNYFAFMVGLVFAFASIMSSGLINRFREEIRLNDSVVENKEKLTYAQIADKAANSSFVRFAFAFGALLVVSIIFIAFGSVTLKTLGLNILIADISGIFASYIATPVIWSSLKK